MKRLAVVGGRLSLSTPRSATGFDTRGSLRCHSNRPSRSRRQDGGDRRRRGSSAEFRQNGNRRDGGDSRKWRSRSPRDMVYFVRPDPPPPPKFDPETLGFAWTNPSQRIGKHPAVISFLNEQGKEMKKASKLSSHQAKTSGAAESGSGVNAANVLESDNAEVSENNPTLSLKTGKKPKDAGQ
ncbi:expressed unknown protein [Seminavis robusta]|uniref:Uncharacterized protein n=1 Tax=Seminavis robusta TaxID=568900 RepID=A0A9N8D712_9STRA|nr:expressed unknown protein [Seminavis robusta]|eukprot:Sro4_g003010.1 n/a (182) ;mRNA; f:27070-27615